MDRKRPRVTGGMAGERRRHGAFLRRLRTDASGNTLAVMAMALIPISALAGSAVDGARLYVVKVRLQQACDAGVLAGRKFMTDSNSTTLDTTAENHAKTFFSNNFQSGWMRVANPQFTPVKTADNQVSATASAVVPMTVMKMFSASDVTLNVSCQARYDVPDVDIVFVLDTTGSMACPPEMSDSDCSTFSGNQTKVAYQRPSDGGGVPGYAGSTTYYVTESTKDGANNSRIDAVRKAVTDFYSTMAANVDASTHVRYGFVTYSSMVNPGKAIIDKSPSYMVGGAGSGTTTHTYQSRQVTADYEISKSSVTGNSRSQSNCGTGFPKNRNPSTALTYTNGTATQEAEAWITYNGVRKCYTFTQTLGPVWTYKPVTYDVANFVAGNTVTTPAQVLGATSKWLGCIEEASTSAGASSFNISNLPDDLNPHLIPNSAASRWKPLWPEVEYLRAAANRLSPWVTQNGDTGDSGNYTNYVDPDRLKLGKMACGKPIKRLGVMTATEVSNFVNATDFRALGGTYHDIGMIWGLRLLSTKGIFANDTAAWPGRPAPKRVLIFLTDGAMAPSADAYSVYGVEQLDQRITNGSGDRTAYHNARFAALCDKAKSADMNIDVWTVAIWTSEIPSLTACASAKAQAVHTTTGQGLSDTFKSIAERVAMLRISQ